MFKNRYDYLVVVNLEFIKWIIVYIFVYLGILLINIVFLDVRFLVVVWGMGF